STYVVQAVFDNDQPFNFVLDTGSSDLWVVSADCDSQDCQAVPRFSPWLSNNFNKTSRRFLLQYLTGSVSGEMCYDTVSLGPYSIANQAFATVEKTVDLGLASTGTSGILGLCFSASAAIPTTVGPTFLENLMSAFTPDKSFFAFHLGRMSGSNDPNASFTIGSLDPKFAPDPTLIAFSPVVRNQVFDYWKIPFERMTVNGVPFILSDSRVVGATAPIAVLDTGTTLILGPTADVAAFYTLLGSCARFDAASSTYLVRCTCAVLVSFVLGTPAREFFLHPADIAWEEGAQGGWCTGGIQANDGVNSGDWLLGDCFLRNVYCVHHYSEDAPMVGLLNMTDPVAAMDEFRAKRGPDVDGEAKDNSDGSLLPLLADDGWDTATGYVKRWEHHPSGAAARIFGAVAGGIGFVVGGVGAISWRFWRGV
ncbi:aspartic peptidase domain-containing protein, partial [Mycena alexandri]